MSLFRDVVDFTDANERQRRGIKAVNERLVERLLEEYDGADVLSTILMGDSSRSMVVEIPEYEIVDCYNLVMDLEPPFPDTDPAAYDNQVFYHFGSVLGRWAAQIRSD